MRRGLAVALILAIAAAASSGSAHPQIRAANPAANAVLASSPPGIRIAFNEDLVAAFSGLELRDGAGRVVAVGPATVNPADKRELAAPLRARLSVGTYTVSWRAVGADTHHVAGSYSFAVRP
ncbi:MAG TPA: copper resistance protein CopC [Caulobacteraceae bacterium]|nr:copper resistance protein CopC [Caulobacteraceae bacterium]